MMNSKYHLPQNRLSQEAALLSRSLKQARLPMVALEVRGERGLHLTADFSSPESTGAYNRTFTVARLFQEQHPKIPMTGEFSMPGGKVVVG